MKTKMKGNWVFAMMLFACLLFTTQGFAQGMRSPEDRAKMMTDRMKTSLSLDETQTKSVYDINLKYAKKNEEIFKGDGDRAAKMKEIGDLQNAKDKEIKAVLTDKQYADYQKMVQDMKSRQRGGDRGNH